MIGGCVEICYYVSVIGISNKIQGGNPYGKGLRKAVLFWYRNDGKGGRKITTNMTKYEMETIINYNAGEQIVTVYTRNKTFVRMSDQPVREYLKSYTALIGYIVGD